MKDNAQNQLLEAERVKEKIRDFESDMELLISICYKIKEALIVIDKSFFNSVFARSLLICFLCVLF
jgi:hypothetical protein